MTSDTKKIPGWDSKDHSNSLFGGISAQWLPENGEAADVTGKLLLLGLKANKLAAFCRASNELVQDGLGFEAQINAAMTKTLGWALDHSFLNGSGAGQPLGALRDPARIVVAKEQNQNAATINYINLTKMFARLAPQCLANSIWLANSTCIPQLLQLYQVIGDAGAPVPVLSQSNGQFSILTRPCVFTEKAPALGSEGDIALVDFTQYAVGMRREVTLDTSIHVGWQQDQKAYRAIMRVDGKGTWNAAITPKNGDSLSWCVVLGKR